MNGVFYVGAFLGLLCGIPIGALWAWYIIDKTGGAA